MKCCSLWGCQLVFQSDCEVKHSFSVSWWGPISSCQQQLLTLLVVGIDPSACILTMGGGRVQSHHGVSQVTGKFLLLYWMVSRYQHLWINHSDLRWFTIKTHGEKPDDLGDGCRQGKDSRSQSFGNLAMIALDRCNLEMGGEYLYRSILLLGEASKNVPWAMPVGGERSKHVLFPQY